MCIYNIVTKHVHSCMLTCRIKEGIQLFRGEEN